MRWVAHVLVPLAIVMRGQTPPQAPPAPDDPVKTIVGRLDLEKYKATIKGLTQFGDRRQGTARNRAALDWIQAQLESYGCAPERLSYTYTPRARTAATGQRGHRRDRRSLLLALQRALFSLSRRHAFARRAARVAAPRTGSSRQCRG